MEGRHVWKSRKFDCCWHAQLQGCWLRAEFLASKEMKAAGCQDYSSTSAARLTS